MMITLRTKRILVIVSFLISVLAIGTVLYFLFFRPLVEPLFVEEQEEIPVVTLPSSGTGTPTTITPTETTTSGLVEAEPIARGGLTETTVLTTSAVSYASLDQTKKGINFYNPEDGKFYTIDEDGNVVLLSSHQFPEAESVDWNMESDKAVIEFPDGTNIVYDFTTEQQVTLPSHWEDFQFSPVTDEIAAKSMGIDPDNRWLVITNANGTNVEAIEALGENGEKVDINWSPNDQVIAFADTSQQLTGSFDRQIILPVGKEGENFKGLTVEGFGFASLWSPNGKQLLYSVSGEYSNYEPLLWIVDATSSNMGENRRSLGLRTWIDKCTFASSTEIYCSVPQSLSANVGLQRELAKNIPDNLYKINLSTGQTSLIAIPATNTVINNPMVSADSSLLYYNNGLTGQLEFIRLR
ncbi:MAG: hypothetical protein UU08_C0002G0021 [Candidatus Uhrbacteria bacterium GW2011_GWE2_40_58]|nr:MAG: hypothetical protein UT94_C0003G0005 [Candidatus Uhrbacteria bacterium GW2011_GWF2_40_263]KKR68170.1 MAG: hypothetical protein UU08_C0002G0021 [Candidatus Uhrbacteria bacterium GW2011_GWE2_40_58]OGL91858.1 MAG: hypothetical protein A2239_01555 [Candidatus Uhrbacteria bacterium RIFOXYA2_FULL_40_9]OGL97674.1 MAG: hypothetical protein A2332_00795 [Candidatus Uhrbacteria bacterium RIFOXYB2_FULL_41_18]HBK34665.1 hypothetical protein [Candidatus Uhrbacteria bacterium]